MPQKKKLMFAIIRNNSNFIQSMLTIRKFKLQIYINILYLDQEYTLQNIQKRILYTTVERLT